MTSGSTRTKAAALPAGVMSMTPVIDLPIPANTDAATLVDSIGWTGGVDAWFKDLAAPAAGVHRVALVQFAPGIDPQARAMALVGLGMWLADPFTLLCYLTTSHQILPVKLVEQRNGLGDSATGRKRAGFTATARAGVVKNIAAARRRDQAPLYTCGLLQGWSPWEPGHRTNEALRLVGWEDVPPKTHFLCVVGSQPARS